MLRHFVQVDVFGERAYGGNPVAVVLDGSELTTEQMQQFANWTNLSETTFVVAPTSTQADYRVRIFTPTTELPFAGHPTLGTCHAWLAAGGVPRSADVVVQECGAGLVDLRRGDDRLAFGAPPLVRSGPVGEDTLDELVSVLGITRAEVVDAQWVDNGPGWVAVLLESADAVLALEPDFGDLHDRYVGAVGPYPPGSESAVEVRAFIRDTGPMWEDPVTGSLNASLAQWLLGSGHLVSPYVASQGGRLHRAGRIHVDADADGAVWIGGRTVTAVTGEVEL